MTAPKYQFYRHEDGHLMVRVEAGRSLNAELAKRLGFLTDGEVDDAEKAVPSDD